MSRALRIEYPGAWYHVMNRGAGRSYIYKTDAQREYFLSLLADTHDRFNAEWHAYCLMDNHYHLMLRTPEGNLQRIMRHINGLYTQYYNRSQKRDGTLFRGRYKAVLVDEEAYWLHLSRYIHRNPLEAKMCKRLDDYPWSSYPAYVGNTESPFWLSTAYLLNSIGQRKLHTRYARFVSHREEDEVSQFYQGGRSGSVLGCEEFISRVTEGIADQVDVPELKMMRRVPSLAEIVIAVCRYFDVEEKAIWKKTRGLGSLGPARGVGMYLCQEVGGMRLSEISDHFDLASYASAGASIRRIRQRMEDDEKLAGDVKYILQDLTP